MHDGVSGRQQASRTQWWRQEPAVPQARAGAHRSSSSQCSTANTAVPVVNAMHDTSLPQGGIILRGAGPHRRQRRAPDLSRHVGRVPAGGGAHSCACKRCAGEQGLPHACRHGQRRLASSDTQNRQMAHQLPPLHRLLSSTSAQETGMGRPAAAAAVAAAARCELQEERVQGARRSWLWRTAAWNGCAFGGGEAGRRARAAAGPGARPPGTAARP